jgi:uncharacterized protein (DUF849 family)
VQGIRQIKVCLNGGRRRDDHPGVPVTPAELALSAAGAVAAGAEAVHVHPRGADGYETLRAADIGAAVEAIRQACPGIPVGVSTGLWITGGDPEARHAAVAEWASLPPAARPDFASVNLSEPGPGMLAGILGAAGIAAEAGVWSVEDVETLVATGLGAGWLRILVEIMRAPARGATAMADEILAALDEAGVPQPRLLHGEGEACWPLVTHAGRRGLPTRIGLEDTAVRPDGGLARSNAELVRLALETWTAAAAR